MALAAGAAWLQNRLRRVRDFPDLNSPRAALTSPNSADYSVAYSATYGSLTQAVAEKDDYLIDLLVDLGFVDEDQVEQSRQEAEAAGVGVVDLMLANKLIRPADVTQAKAAHFGAEVVALGGMQIEDDVIAAIPRHIAKKYRVIPVYQGNRFTGRFRTGNRVRPQPVLRRPAQRGG